jgi:hypothetical protein
MHSEQWIIDAQKTLHVSAEAAASYAKAKELLLEDVNAFLTSHPRLAWLIGGNPLTMMYDHHRNHIDFLSTVFTFQSFDLLAKTLPWVYRTYHAHGFSYEYFPVELDAWKRAIGKHLPPRSSR